MFSLTIIGKYGPYPKAGGATTCYLLKIGNKNIIIDLGTGSLSRLQTHIDLTKIDAIILTHLHHDHMVDAFILRYALAGKGIKPIPMFIPDTPAYYEFNVLAQASCFDVKPITEKTKISFFGATVTFKAMIHPVVTHAVKIEYKNKVFVFSSDTTSNEQLSSFASGCDLFLCDSAVPQIMWKKGYPHPSAVQVGVMANDAKAKRLILTHIHPMTNENLILKDAKSFFENTVVAEEDKTYNI